ncbi:MAG: type II toxin-antitoxin system RelE/ParE family toxin [Pseudomonadota bacterium]|nr:type II toxin-antitoxin system RelE/ParE family toxin [Pseudomonadota bacterium]
MNYSIFLTDDAVRDLDELFDYIILNDIEGKGEYVIEQLEKAIDGLSKNPDRGVYPKELSDIGIREYREIFFKPYRIVYRVISAAVYVVLIADGRRDMQTLLQRRVIQ